MIVKVQKLSEDAVMPHYATEGSAAFDLTAISRKVVQDGAWYIEYDTGLAFEIPEGFVGLLFPRSSISNVALSLSNSVGVVDSDYRGPVKLRFRALPVPLPEDHMTSDDSFLNALSAYKVGERVGQMIIIETPKIELKHVQELTDTKRGTGGYGSTGA